MTSLIVGIAGIGYLLGSIPFGLLLTKAAGLGDIRAIGSGNIGATNVLRTGRKGLAAATLLLDGGKGAAAALLGGWFDGDMGLFVGALAAMAGHLYPCWLEFRGGKGVATAFGILIAVSPLVGLSAGAVWILVAALLRYSSAAALAAFAAAPVLGVLLDHRRVVLGVSLCLAGLVYLRHQGNIARLMAGTEPRIGQK